MLHFRCVGDSLASHRDNICGCTWPFMQKRNCFCWCLSCLLVKALVAKHKQKHYKHPLLQKEKKTNKQTNERNIQTNKQTKQSAKMRLKLELKK